MRSFELDSATLTNYRARGELSGDEAARAGMGSAREERKERARLIIQGAPNLNLAIRSRAAAVA